MVWPALTEFGQGFGVLGLTLLVWSALGLFLAVLFQGTSLAIGLGLVYAVVLELAIGGLAGLVDLFKTASKYLPGVNLGRLADALGSPLSETNRQEVTVSVTHALVVLSIYVVGFLLISGFLFRRRDVT